MKFSIIKKKFHLCLFTFISINHFILQKPVHAFIPYIYMPSNKVLTNTGIGIGLTASQYIKVGQIEQAIELSKLAVSLHPNEGDLWIILATAQLNNNLLKEALFSIEKANLLDPKNPSIWFTKASIEMQMGEIGAAIKSINKTIKFDNSNANAYFLLGNARLIQKKHINALQAFQKAKDINPKLWQAMNNEGLIYFELGKKKKAIQLWRKVLIIEEDAEPKLALAIALYSMEPNNTESIKLAKEALQANPNYFFQEHQKEQLWGQKLQIAGKELLKNPKLDAVVKKAQANSNLSNKNKNKTGN